MSRMTMIIAMDIASDDSTNCAGIAHERQNVIAALSASTSPA